MPDLFVGYFVDFCQKLSVTAAESTIFVKLRADFVSLQHCFVKIFVTPGKGAQMKNAAQFSLDGI